MTTDERRIHARVSIEKPCKVFHRASRRYIPGKTCDVSSGGAMLWLDSPRPLSPGDEIEVCISWDAQAVVPASSMTNAAVVRLAARFAEHQAVAIRFDQPQTMAAAA